MTEYMGTISGPLPDGVDPQGDEVCAIGEALMDAAIAEDYDPVAGGDGQRGTWSLTVTVGDMAHCEWRDALDELLHLADKLGRPFTSVELTSYDDPLFR